MNPLKRIKKKLSYIYRRYILRDPFYLEVERWFSDNGDENLRLDYPLTQESVVFDLGGYHGDFAAAVHERYRCALYVFEPVPQFYQLCVNRFRGNDKIACLNYGLSSAGGWLDIEISENASSFSTPLTKGNVQKVQVRSVVECIRDLNIGRIDLMKVNIEGGEYDVLPAIIESGDISKVKFLQIQFHDFVSNAAERRGAIRVQLSNTHTEIWSYVFVWECWKLNGVAIE